MLALPKNITSRRLICRVLPVHFVVIRGYRLASRPFPALRMTCAEFKPPAILPAKENGAR